MPITLNPIALSTSLKNSPSKTSPLSKSSQTLNTSRTQKTLTPQYLEKKFQDLYLEVIFHQTKNQRWNAKRQKLRQQNLMTKQQEELKECTFQPMVNPEIQFNGSNPSPFLKREIDWVHKKEKKIEELYRQTEKKLKKQCSFRPKISSKTYAILNQSHKIETSRNLFETSRKVDTQQPKQKKGSCYREIHMKQEGYKELQKANSVHHFTLMTERRFASKMGQLEENGQKDEECEQFNNNRMNSLTSRPYFKFTEEEDYIENIAIKTEQQNTFDSVTEMELKTVKKEQGINIKVQNDQEEEQKDESKLNQHIEESEKEYDENHQVVEDEQEETI